MGRHLDDALQAFAATLAASRMPKPKGKSMPASIWR